MPLKCGSRVQATWIYGCWLERTVDEGTLGAAEEAVEPKVVVDTGTPTWPNPEVLEAAIPAAAAFTLLGSSVPQLQLLFPFDPQVYWHSSVGMVLLYAARYGVFPSPHVHVYARVFCRELASRHCVRTLLGR